MCFGNTVTCLQCRQSRIHYRERCDRGPSNDGSVYQPSPNHYIDGVRRHIFACPSCWSARRQTERTLAADVARDQGRAKALLENMQGRRLFPQINRSLTEGQCRQMYLLRERLHPFVSDSPAMFNMTRELVDQATRSHHPLAWTITARWAETVERQRALDRYDFALTAADTQFRLDAIQASASDYICHESQVRAPPTLERQILDAFEPVINEVPRSFDLFLDEDNELIDRESAPSLQTDVDRYTNYLGRVIPAWLSIFEAHFNELCANEQSAWNTTALSNYTGTIESPFFRNFVEIELESTPEQSPISPRDWRRLLKEYREHLEVLLSAEDISLLDRQQAEEEEADRQWYELHRRESEQLSLVPISFEIWTQRNPPSGNLPAHTHLANEIFRYEHEYLSRNEFRPDDRIAFTNTVHRLQEYSMDNFLYQPLDIDGHSRLSFRQFALNLRQGEVIGDQPDTQRTWSGFLDLRRRYEAYLDHPQHVAHWLGALCRWAQGDRRELFGQARNDFDENLERLDDTIETISNDIFNEALQILRRAIVIVANLEQSRQGISSTAAALESNPEPDRAVDSQQASLFTQSRHQNSTQRQHVHQERPSLFSINPGQGLLPPPSLTSDDPEYNTHLQRSSMFSVGSVTNPPPPPRFNTDDSENNLYAQRSSMFSVDSVTNPPPPPRFNTDDSENNIHTQRSSMFDVGRVTSPLPQSMTLPPLPDLQDPFLEYVGFRGPIIVEAIGDVHVMTEVNPQRNQLFPAGQQDNRHRRAQDTVTPSSESSNFDDDDRLIELSNMLHSSDSHSDTSSNDGDEEGRDLAGRDGEMSEEVARWFAQPNAFEERLSPTFWDSVSMFGSHAERYEGDDDDEMNIDQNRWN